MREFAASFYDRSTLIFRFWIDDSERADYDRLEVWRSTASSGGPYVELTGDTWGPAVITGRRGQGALVGKTLELLVGTVPLIVTFTGTDSLTLGSIASQIQAAALGLLSASAGADTYTLTLTTADVGCRARIEITGGNAAPILGFSAYPPTNRAYGTDARPQLVTGRGAYTFEDPWAQGSTYFYKTRMRKSSDSSVSEFSNSFRGDVTRAVTADRLVRGWLRLIDVQGRPIRGRSIMLSTRDTVHVLSVDQLLVDVGDQQLFTDENGYCSMLLFRGLVISVGIAGTALVRDVSVPTDPSIDSFNLFDPTTSTDDAFTVQVPDVNIAERTECA
jgi:hypothetical protein